MTRHDFHTQIPLIYPFFCFARIKTCNISSSTFDMNLHFFQKSNIHIFTTYLTVEKFRTCLKKKTVENLFKPKAFLEIQKIILPSSFIKN